MSLIMTFSDAACDYIKRMVDKEQGVGFRLSVKKTGCSGYTYLPAVVEKANLTDIHFEIANQVNIFVDINWLHMLQGLHVDYIEEGKLGLKQKRLVFTNPNESSR